jgi:hypothetical protein
VEEPIPSRAIHSVRRAVHTQRVMPERYPRQPQDSPPSRAGGPKQGEPPGPPEVYHRSNDLGARRQHDGIRPHG